jgi:hypothetical protein
MLVLNADMLLTVDNLLLIFQSGHPRILVYDGTPTFLFGVLFAKGSYSLGPGGCSADLLLAKLLQSDAAGCL